MAAPWQTYLAKIGINSLCASGFNKSSFNTTRYHKNKKSTEPHLTQPQISRTPFITTEAGVTQDRKMHSRKTSNLQLIKVNEAIFTITIHKTKTSGSIDSINRSPFNSISAPLSPKQAQLSATIGAGLTSSSSTSFSSSSPSLPSLSSSSLLEDSSISLISIFQLSGITLALRNIIASSSPREMRPLEDKVIPACQRSWWTTCSPFLFENSGLKMPSTSNWWTSFLATAWLKENQKLEP